MLPHAISVILCARELGVLRGFAVPLPVLVCESLALHLVQLGNLSFAVNLT
jgi:hypothetical protein